jgi:hypothetical protein
VGAWQPSLRSPGKLARALFGNCRARNSGQLDRLAYRHSVIAVLVFGVAVLGLTVGVLIGFGIGTSRTRDALRVRRYDDAIAVLTDLVNTPDSLDLRDRAQRVLAAHRAALPEQEF